MTSVVRLGARLPSIVKSVGRATSRGSTTLSPRNSKLFRRKASISNVMSMRLAAFASNSDFNLASNWPSIIFDLFLASEAPSPEPKPSSTEISVLIVKSSITNFSNGLPPSLESTNL
ncbi:hypothetical protein D3C80_1939040 [compost metagenome]